MSVNDNTLKKEFSQRDVNRARNLLTKKFGDATGIQSGYTKQVVEHSEGEVWEEDGRKWTIKNGIKQTVTRFDKLKEALNIPLTCPKCDKAMKNHTLNKKMWPLHKMCFNCVVEMETELKRTGQFEEYARSLTTRGIKTHIDELEQFVLEIALEDSNEGFVTEQGDVEKWTGKGLDKQKITAELQEYIQKLKEHIGS